MMAFHQIQRVLKIEAFPELGDDRLEVRKVVEISSIFQNVNQMIGNKTHPCIQHVKHSSWKRPKNQFRAALLGNVVKCSWRVRVANFE